MYGNVLILERPFKDGHTVLSNIRCISLDSEKFP
jgi:hypothetical protein